MHQLFQGRIVHNRLIPTPHSFSYHIALFYFDLQRLDTAFSKVKFYGVNTAALASFQRKDYYGDPDIPLIKEIQSLVKERTGMSSCLSEKLKIFLLTSIRTFGFCFNPVSFYFCYDEANQLQALVADVTNTPWHKRYAYVLDCRIGQEKGVYRFTCDKNFHVSPFMSMDMQYEWLVTKNHDSITIQMHLSQQSLAVFSASLHLYEITLTNAQLYKKLFLHIPIAIKTVVLIYVNAMVLFLKRVPFYSYPK
ncbi:MAG: DUF1365 domain-containing protein [Methylacidiphilales bacterium]|nr:DUF1365 domain-containing protein [Candidatus Methylacidiphilales bacterium]